MPYNTQTHAHTHSAMPGREEENTAAPVPRCQRPLAHWYEGEEKFPNFKFQRIIAFMYTMRGLFLVRHSPRDPSKPTPGQQNEALHPQPIAALG